MLIKKGTTEEQGTWRRSFLMGKDQEPVILLNCPKCGNDLGVAGWHYKNHTIAPDGTVSPSMVCTHDGCDFHEFIKLENY